jgi:hypothetical protein
LCDAGGCDDNDGPFPRRFLNERSSQLGKLGLQPLAAAKQPIVPRPDADAPIPSGCGERDGNGGGIAFEAKLKFEGTQGGMIAGFFTYQQFPPGADRDIHDEIDVEILTTNLNKLSTNVYAHESGQKTAHPLSIAVISGTFSDWHTYRMEWFPDHVSWFIDGDLLRTETDHVPTQPQQLHMNLWGVPTDWGPSPGDPNGPPIGDPNFTPAKNASDNQTYFFDVTTVKVEQLNP